MFSNPACPDCHVPVKVAHAKSRIKHKADGTHTVTAPSRPKQVTDPKRRGRPRG